MVDKEGLGTESVGKLFVKLSIPSVLAMLINLLYNVVDRMYIGHIENVGAEALTGVGVTLPIIMFISAFASLCGMGGAPKAAIKMGENDEDGANKILGNCLTLTVIVALILTALFSIFSKDLLLAFGASYDTLPYALEYINMYVIGTLFVMLSLGLNAFITTQGFSKQAMMNVIIGAVANIILDPIFIYGFNMGVKGGSNCNCYFASHIRNYNY